MSPPVAAPSPPPEASTGPACPNCGTPFAVPRPKHCGECGQESDLRAPTVMELLQQFGGAYLSTEGALWRTLWRLLLPGQLSLEYLAGRRRRYVLPLRLYLTISLLALLSLRVVTSARIEEQAALAGASAAASAAPLARPQDRPAERPSFQIGGLGGARLGMADGVYFCEGLPDSVCQRMARRLSLDHAGQVKELVQWSERALSHLGITMFVLLPAFALWLKLVQWGSPLRYTEHMVVALHLHAFWFAMLLLALVPLEAFSVAAGLASVVYPVIALHRIYGTRWWSTLLRAGLLLVLNLCGVALVLAVFGVLTLLS